MESNTFFDDLPGMDFGPDIPDARSDAKTTLASLPAELLLDITDYLKYKEVYALMTVNRLLHGVAIQRCYANVYVNARRIKFPAEMNPDSPLEDITGQMTLKQLGIIGGLLARKGHLHTLRLFHLVSTSTESENFLPLLSTLMRAVISRAPRLRELRLPDFSNHNPASTLLDFSGLTFPTNFSTLVLYIPTPSGYDHKANNHTRFIQDVIEKARPRILKLLDWNPPEAVEYIAEAVGSDIEVFQADFHLRDTEEFSSETVSKLIAERMPNLTELTIGFETSTPSRELWRQAMTEDIINSLCSIVRSLRKLKKLTINECCVIGWKREEELIGQLSRCSSSLKSIVLVTSGYNYELWHEGSRGALEWRKWQDYEELTTIWSPRPDEWPAKEWWTAKFKTSEMIRVIIRKMWPEIVIPYYWCY